MRKRNGLVVAASVVLITIGVGCPPGGPTGNTGYDAGYAAGFLRDDYYWDGYFDGWDTVKASPFYYDTSGIPYIDDLTYDAGYWDGVWYAYNDGYFADYHYAFIIGFSEGYDNAYWGDYLDFLAYDKHTEYKNGGWSDGYHDGYSEGRIFGANDYEQGLNFDWLDALLDYESGTDLYFSEINLGTGVYGPVKLYEYGTDPATLKKLAKALMRSGKAVPSIRNTAKAASSLDWFRPFDTEAADLLDVAPSQSLRDSIKLRLTTTWLDRVNAYLGAAKSSPANSHTPRGRTRSE